MSAEEGGTPRRVTYHPGDDDEPSFSHDGKWIYINSTRSGRVEVCRAPFASGKEEQITAGSGSLAREAPDGKTIYYALTPGPMSALLHCPARAGPEISPWLRYPPPPIRGGSPANRSGSSAAVSFAAIRFYDFATRTSHEVHRLPGHRRFGRGFSVSPDRKTFFYVADEGNGWDLMLIENFR